MVQPQPDDRTTSFVEPFVRVEPPLTEPTHAFWSAAAHGVLRVARCPHPPRPVCARCWSRTITPEPVSGRATVWTWTVNRYQWQTTMAPPYVLAEVELVEQPGLRLLTNIVDCAVDEVRIGLEVEV